MSFSDGGTSSAGADPGQQGFLSIFGSQSETAAPTTDSQTDTTSTETVSPASTEPQYETADDFIAARMDASLEADGYEVAEPGAEDDDETETDDVTALSVEGLTPEEIRALAEEALTLKQQSQVDQETRVQEYVRTKVQEAETAAVAVVDQAFRTQVLSQSEAHYDNQYRLRVDAIIKASRSQADPDTYIAERSAAAARLVWNARQKWESDQAQEWNQRAIDAALAARRTVPELRQYFAITLVREFGLPEAAIADIAHPNRDIDTFRQRAEELVGIARFAGTERKKSAQSRREQANGALKEQPIRTPATGKPRGGKPPDYRGTAEEGAALLKMFHTN